MLTEQNFRPFTSLLKSGYTVQVELGDLIQDKQVWHDQAMRVTISSPGGEVQWKIFRGAKSRLQAAEWIRDMTSGVIQSI